jgi:hypothetical protein
MPALSLVVCLHGERDLLERLLSETAGCHDDLVVVHDGEEESAPPARISDLVHRAGGRFFVRPRSYQQEPHWPFALAQARHEWILRLDADEIPSVELREWLRSFRIGSEPDSSVSGYSCIWPLWDGRKIVTEKWPAGRVFLFHKQRVRFFGMVEQIPVADGRWETLPFILEHRPIRKSYGLKNVLLRRQAYAWRRVIAKSLLGKPTDLPHWRWQAEEWPEVWEQIRRRPLSTALYRLFVWPLLASSDLWRAEGRFIPAATVSGGIHHFLIALTYWQISLRATRR